VLPYGVIGPRSGAPAALPYGFESSAHDAYGNTAIGIDSGAPLLGLTRSYFSTTCQYCRQHRSRWGTYPTDLPRSGRKVKYSRRPIADYRDFDAPLDIRQKSNELLEAEPLESPSMEIRHSRLIRPERMRRHILIVSSDKRDDLSAQLLFQSGDWITGLNHSQISSLLSAP